MARAAIMRRLQICTTSSPVEPFYMIAPESLRRLKQASDATATKGLVQEDSRLIWVNGNPNYEFVSWPGSCSPAQTSDPLRCYRSFL